jgi:tRNA (Thr-GGU) A37 N-methylase
LGIWAVRLRNHPRKGERAVPDVMVWVTKPGDEEVQVLETLGEEVRGLDHVSEVDVRVEGARCTFRSRVVRPSRRRSKTPSGKWATRSPRFLLGEGRPRETLAEQGVLDEPFAG